MNSLISHYLFTNYDFTPETISAISQKGRMISLNKGDLYKIGAGDESQLIFVLEGHLKLISLDQEGDQNVMELLHTGEMIDSNSVPEVEDSFLQSLAHKTQIAVMSVVEFHYLLTRNEGIVAETHHLFNDRILKLHRRMNYLNCRDVLKRLQLFLNDLAIIQGKISGGSIVVENYLTHHDIAEITNMSRQTVTSLLNKLRAEGKIEYNRREMVLLDKEWTKSLLAA